MIVYVLCTHLNMSVIIISLHFVSSQVQLNVIIYNNWVLVITFLVY